MTKKLASIGAISFVHLAVFYGLLIFSHGSSMQAFDSGQPGQSSSMLHSVMDIVSFPLVTLAGTVKPKYISSFFQILIVLLNSVLWGLAIYFLASAVFNYFRSQRQAHGA